LDSTQVSVALSPTYPTTYPPPSMDLVTMPTKNGRRRALVIMAAANCNVFVYQIGEQSNENAGMTTFCLATQGGRGSHPQYSTSRRNACVTCVKIAEEAYDRPHCRLFATTDNGKVFMATMDTLLKPPNEMRGRDEKGKEGGKADKQCDIPTRFGDKEKTMGSLDPFGATSCAIYRDEECFVSDMHGQIHHWNPKKPESHWLTKVYENENERPIQSLAVDPCSDYLVATDWNGIVYFWQIEAIKQEQGDQEEEDKEKEEEIDESSDDHRIQLKPQSYKDQGIIHKPPRDDGVYGLRCVWCGDGSRFAVAQSSGKVYLFHLVGRVPTLMDVVVAGDRTAWVWDCGWDFGGKLLVTANSAGFIKFWEENKLEKEISEISENEVSGKTGEPLDPADECRVSQIKWKSLNHREIKLKEHQSQPDSNTVISSLIYREIPKDIFKAIKKPEDDRFRPY